MKIELIAITTDAECVIERCARVSYASEMSAAPGAFLAARRRAGHWSIFEHSHAVFIIDGLSRVCAQQLTRHRHLSFTMESQRYVAPGGESAVPPTIAANPEAAEVYEDAIVPIGLAYDRLRAMGIPREDARFILPGGMLTSIAVSGNFRAWHEMLAKRLVPAAQWEIRALARGVLEILNQHAPATFGDLWEEYGQ